MAAAGEALMAKMASGDVDAFETLLSTYQGAAYRYAYRIFRNRHTAEDATQEFFFKLFRNAAKYEPAGKFTTYFYRVLHNLCLDFLRRMNRKSLPDFLSFENPVLDTMPIAEGEGAPERATRLNEEKRLVREAIGKLAPAQRQVIILKFMEDFDNASAAKVLGRSQGAVKSLQHRALLSLKRILSDE